MHGAHRNEIIKYLIFFNLFSNLQQKKKKKKFCFNLGYIFKRAPAPAASISINNNFWSLILTPTTQKTPVARELGEFL